MAIANLDQFGYWNHLPVELQHEVIGFLGDTRDSELDNSIRTLAQCRLVNKNFEYISSEVLQPLKKQQIERKIEALIKTYHIYNERYAEALKDIDKTTLGRKHPDPKGPPQLLDALFSGSRFTLGTLNFYNEIVERDIKDIILYMPESMNCVMGELRCRMSVTPLVAAIVNPNIPIHIIEFMFEHGADANGTLEFNGYEVKIYHDLGNFGLYPSRIEKIQALFVKYGYVDS